VFWVQCAVAATNIVLAVVLVGQTGAKFTSPALVLAYTGSYAVGSLASYLILHRLLGGLESRVLVRFLVRTLVAAAVAGGLAWLAARGLHQLADEPGKAMSALIVGVVLGVDGVSYLALARAMRVREVTSVLELVSQRLPRTRNR